MQATDQKAFRKKIGLVALFIFLVHITLCLLLIFFPGNRLSYTYVGRAYALFALVGPFFDDARIQHTLHLSFRYKTNDRWSEPADLVDYYFKSYVHQPWRYQDIVMRDFTRTVASNVSGVAGRKPFDVYSNGYAFKQLNRLIVRQIPANEKADSIQVVYFSKWCEPYAETVKLDTLFSVTYLPSAIEPID